MRHLFPSLIAPLCLCPAPPRIPPHAWQARHAHLALHASCCGQPRCWGWPVAGPLPTGRASHCPVAADRRMPVRQHIHSQAHFPPVLSTSVYTSSLFLSPTCLNAPAIFRTCTHSRYHDAPPPSNNPSLGWLGLCMRVLAALLDGFDQIGHVGQPRARYHLQCM